jgi:GAF domain-containing protein
LRIKALRRYSILDSNPEQSFDDITKLASLICATPISIMTLVNSNRQWFKAKVGLAAPETPREQAFCAYTIMENNLMVVEDAQSDARFASNPLVTGDPHIRFYAGAPLITPDGFALGSLCVIDREPRQLTTEQTTSLEALARLVMTQMEFRDVSSHLAQALSNVKTLSGMLPICSYCKGIRNDDGYWQRVESYVMKHTNTEFTHGICPECFKVNFPDLAAKS